MFSESALAHRWGLLGSRILHGNLYFCMALILGRVTEAESGLNTKFEDYVNRSIRNPFDIEHIWADHPERHNDELKVEEFETYRNKFGALLILPRDKNRSFQDATYEEKLPMYFGENLLAKSLDEKCYRNNPQFLNFIHNHNLRFKPHQEFKKADISERQNLYKEICKQLWDVNKLYSLAGQCS